MNSVPTIEQLRQVDRRAWEEICDYLEKQEVQQEAFRSAIRNAEDVPLRRLREIFEEETKRTR
jgi:hypothetical protein